MLNEMSRRGALKALVAQAFRPASLSMAQAFKPANGARQP